MTGSEYPFVVSGYPYVVTMHRIGAAPVRLGFVFRFQAEDAYRSLCEDLIGTRHVPGTHITWGGASRGVVSLAPVPTSPEGIAELLVQGHLKLPEGNAFPGLYSRLKAQVGYEKAARIWTEACSMIDAEEAGRY
jgi:hypothetical protein